MKKWMFALTALLIISNGVFAQVRKDDFNPVPRLTKVDFQLHEQQDPFSVENKKSERPPVIETTTDKPNKPTNIVKDDNGGVERDVGNHKWREIPAGSGQYLTQRYYDEVTKTTFRYLWPIPNTVPVNKTAQPVQNIQNNNEAINPPPVYQQQTFVPQQQLFYNQPQPMFQRSISFGFSSSSSRNC